MNVQLLSSKCSVDRQNIWVIDHAFSVKMADQVLFCVFMDRDEVEVHKHAQKNLANIQPS